MLNELGLSAFKSLISKILSSIWPWMQKLIGWRFKQVFGPGVSCSRFALVYAELELTDARSPYPYRKPGGRLDIGVSITRPVSVCEVRAANYLASAIGSATRSTPSLSSDVELRTELNLDFASFGGPFTNSKSDDCQSNRGNKLARIDQGANIIGLEEGQPLVDNYEPGFDYGLILKVRPTQFPSRVWLMCAGRGEWGTSGAAWFLSSKWSEIRKLAGSKPFAIVVRVRLGQDQSAEAVRSLVGKE